MATSKWHVLNHHVDAIRQVGGIGYIDAGCVKALTDFSKNVTGLRREYYLDSWQIPLQKKLKYQSGMRFLEEL